MLYDFVHKEEKKKWNGGERIELWWQENIIDYDNIYNSIKRRKKQAKEPSHTKNTSQIEQEKKY